MNDEYYNTNYSKGSQLDVFVAAARKQNERVLEVFRSEKKPMTPLMVLDKIFKHETDHQKLLLVTSIRRSINTLTRSGFLVKTGNQVKERLGRPNHLWTLKEML